jgi:hypothetical protein
MPQVQERISCLTPLLAATIVVRSRSKIGVRLMALGPTSEREAVTDVPDEDTPPRYRRVRAVHVTNERSPSPCR